MIGGEIAPIGLVVALLGVVAGLAVVLERERRRLRRRLAAKRRALAEATCYAGSRIPTIPLAQLDPRFRALREGLGPGEEAGVHLIGRGDAHVAGAPSDTETWILSCLARDARCIFEFGTGSGRTTWALAVNSPADARVTTLTLGPGTEDLARQEPGDASEAIACAIGERVEADLFYVGTAVESKIEQRYGDSKAFDEKSFEGRCDLVFVDGSHARSWVASDSRKALAMLRPGGLVLWHDLRDPRFPGTRGVVEVLTELLAELPLVHISGTSLVAFRG